MATDPKKLYIAADVDVTVDDLAIRSTEAAITTATVTYALKDSAFAAVSGGTGTLSHVSSGNYLGVIESTVTSTLTEDATYYVDVTIVSGSYNDFRRIKCTAKYREEE